MPVCVFRLCTTVGSCESYSCLIFFSWLGGDRATNLLVLRDANFKGRTLPNNTFDKDLRAMRFRNPPRDREAKPDSGLSGACLVCAIEALENKRKVLLGYADAGVAHLSKGIVAICL